jgi:hypothetical protein
MSRVNLGTVPHHPNEKHRVPLPDGVPRPPILGMFVAKRGQGKSTAAVRLLKYYIDHSPPVFHQKFTYVVSPTAESQKHLWDHLGLEEDNVFVASTEKQVRGIIDDIVVKLKEEKLKYDEDQDYIKAYRKLLRGAELTPREELLLDMRDCQPLENPTPWPRPMLILDDLSHMKVMDRPWFISLCLRHRHLAGGVSLSMIAICQSLRGGLSRVVRQNCSLICLWSTHDKTALDDLYQECSHLLDKPEFEAVFHAATEDFHDFLAVDLSQHDPNMVFSKNLEKWYQIHQKKIEPEDNIHQNKKDESVRPEPTVRPDDSKRSTKKH